MDKTRHWPCPHGDRGCKTVNARFQQSPNKHHHHKLRSSPQEAHLSPREANDGKTLTAGGRGAVQGAFLEEVALEPRDDRELTGSREVEEEGPAFVRQVGFPPKQGDSVTSCVPWIATCRRRGRE